ncbi:hypothetical protein SKAU_G00252480 [Synaphobranchus kaupii]|uniref:Uncharacterized protein n=1 Tax=Synaphobranchus kaupii TaxID=118154 RepID=A0A9Q1F351_SYNKA|nr:hypothetical protein SKAU_G00252480 [Synaphobranchus kaupii]
MAQPVSDRERGDTAASNSSGPRAGFISLNHPSRRSVIHFQNDCSRGQITPESTSEELICTRRRPPRNLPEQPPSPVAMETGGNTGRSVQRAGLPMPIVKSPAEGWPVRERRWCSCLTRLRLH